MNIKRKIMLWYLYRSSWLFKIDLSVSKWSKRILLWSQNDILCHTNKKKDFIVSNEKIYIVWI